MRVIVRFLLCALAGTLVASSPAHAGDSAAPGTAPAAGLAATAAAAAHAKAPSPTLAAPAQPPLARAVREALDDEARQLAPLHEALARTTDAAQALELQRRIERIKQDTELQVLRAQSAHARVAGDLACAARLDAIVAAQEQLRRRGLRGEPQPRPMPVPDATSRH